MRLCLCVTLRFVLCYGSGQCYNAVLCCVIHIVNKLFNCCLRVLATLLCVLCVLCVGLIVCWCVLFGVVSVVFDCHCLWCLFVFVLHCLCVLCCCLNVMCF